MEPLQQWLKEKCDEQNLSWREASMGADLNPGAISAIMGGQVPGLESCKALAKFFRVSPVFVLHLAGHIEGITPEELTDLRYDPNFIRLVECYRAAGPQLRAALLDIALVSVGQPLAREILPRTPDEYEYPPGCEPTPDD